MEGEKPIVLITGISGYVGSQVCLYFLKNGSFKVRGTVRSTKNQAKMEPLKKAYGEDLFSQLELVEADLLNEESLIAACEGCTYIVHTASPFPLTPPKNEDELIKPAVEGTLAALKGAEKFGVKRVVITSSLAAVYAISPSLNKTQFSENDWSDPKVAKAYDKSKTLAEKAAWDFVKALPDDKKIELATINPGWVLGPNLVTCSFSSGDGIKQFMDGSLPSYPLIKMPLVDVRDVAEAHLQAILKPEAAGRRFFMASESMWMGDMCKILTDKWGKQYKIPQKQASKCMMTILSWFITDIKIIMPQWGRENNFDNKPAREVLGINFIPMTKCLPEFTETLIETGYMDPPKAKK